MVVVNRDYPSITTLTLTGNYNKLGIGSDEIRCNAFSVSQMHCSEFGRIFGLYAFFGRGFPFTELSWSF